MIFMNSSNLIYVDIIYFQNLKYNNHDNLVSILSIFTLLYSRQSLKEIVISKFNL
jgi:phage tail sheath gpL-like